MEESYIAVFKNDSKTKKFFSARKIFFVYAAQRYLEKNKRKVVESFVITLLKQVQVTLQVFRISPVLFFCFSYFYRPIYFSSLHAELSDIFKVAVNYLIVTSFIL